MSSAFAAQVCRIVVPEKLTDRFLVSGLLRQNDSSSLEDQVILAYVLEVSQPWFPSSHVLPAIISALTAQHSQLKPGDQLGDQFEVLLRAVNEQLNAISEQGETDWIGNLNGLIMVLSGEQLHFSQTGRCPAYLLQKNRIRQVTDDTQEKDPHPLKTFSNLASGMLQEGDYILVSNQELYNEISLDALRRIMNSSTPFLACQAISRELKKQKNLAVSPFIAHIISSESTAPAAEPEEIILEEEMQGPLAKFQRRLQPVAAALRHHGGRAGRAGLKVAKQAQEGIKTSVLPKANELIQKGVEQAKNLRPAPAVTPPAETETTESAPEEIVPETPAEPTTATEESTVEIVESEKAETPAVSTPFSQLPIEPKEDLAADLPEAVVEVILPKEQRDAARHEQIAQEAEDKADALYASEDEPDTTTASQATTIEQAVQAAEEAEAAAEEPAPAEPSSVVPASEFALDSDLPIGLMSTEPNQQEASIASEKQAGLPRSGIKKTWATFPYKRLVALSVGILLLVVTVTLVTRSRKPGTSAASTNQNNTLLDAAQQLQAKAAAALSINPPQEIEASNEVTQALAKLQEIKDPSDSQTERLNTIWDNLTTQADILSKTNRLTPATTYSFLSSATGMAATLPYFYGFGSPAALLRTGKGDASQTQATVDLPDSADAIISLSSSNETDTAAYVLTRKNRVFRITQSGQQTSLRHLSPSTGDFATADAINSYNGNIYLLDGKTGLLWKYAASGGGTYAKGVSLLDINKYDIKKSVSLAIDGSIYVLKADGSLDKFTSGTQESGFSLQGIPTINSKLVMPLKVITSDTMQSIYVLDGGVTSGERSTARLLEFNKSGAFIRQYAFPKDYTRVTSFDINPAQKKLWILNNGQVAEFDLP